MLSNQIIAQVGNWKGFEFDFWTDFDRPFWTNFDQKNIEFRNKFDPSQLKGLEPLSLCIWCNDLKKDRTMFSLVFMKKYNLNYNIPKYYINLYELHA